MLRNRANKTKAAKISRKHKKIEAEKNYRIEKTHNLIAFSLASAAEAEVRRDAVNVELTNH
eukprot:5934981-Pleurochrysis_carterae.AAC.2